MLIDGIKQTLLDYGKQAMNSKYPNDFEFYMIALELVSIGTGKTLKYFVFPVMPSSMSNQKSFNTFIQQTYGGVSVNTTSTFTPFDINLMGDFGRGLKILVGETLHDVLFTFDEFNTKVKTGYGCIKMLESILEESVKVDENGQRLLFYYNLAFNDRYLVTPISQNFSQNLSKNMIWDYSIVLKAISPVSYLNIEKEEDTDELIKLSSKKQLLHKTLKRSTGIIKNILAQVNVY